MVAGSFLFLVLGGEIVIALLLVLGGLFTLVGSLGLLRFEDFFMRLHAPTKATTLGVGGLLLAGLMTAWLDGRFGLAELLITLFLFLGAPISASLLAQAALHRHLASKAPLPEPPARD